jgi:hypothetical protein
MAPPRTTSSGPFTTPLAPPAASARPQPALTPTPSRPAVPARTQLDADEFGVDLDFETGSTSPSPRGPPPATAKKSAGAPKPAPAKGAVPARSAAPPRSPTPGPLAGLAAPRRTGTPLPETSGLAGLFEDLNLSSSSSPAPSAVADSAFDAGDFFVPSETSPYENASGIEARTAPLAESSDELVAAFDRGGEPALGGDPLMLRLRRLAEKLRAEDREADADLLAEVLAVLEMSGA